MVYAALVRVGISWELTDFVTAAKRDAVQWGLLFNGLSKLYFCLEYTEKAIVYVM